MDAQDSRGLGLVVAGERQYLVDVALLEFAQRDPLLPGRRQVHVRRFVRLLGFGEIADFFRQVGSFKRQGQRFDCVFLDPPFFSSSPSGVVDQISQSARLINKVRPLVNDDGTLVAVNNALYVSGADYMRTLEDLCADGYLSIQMLIPVPRDFTVYAETRRGAPLTDPAPFNHSTKIAVLEVRRKSKENA